ncbi:unnamed protein product [Ectocarpus sp. 12 AP-2014]
MAKQGNGSAPDEMPVADDSSKPVHVMDLIKQFDFLSIGLTGKIHCALTNRDLPLNSAAVHQHLNSKKLKKEREWYNADFSKYEPFVVAHKTNPKLLFCTLTRMELNRIPKEVEDHVNGKRYRNRKAEMEGLKQAQRQPLGEDSEEEDEEENGAEFWVPTGGAEAMDEGGESDQQEDEEEEDEEDDEAEEGGAGGGVKLAPRRKDKDQSAAREGRQKESGKKGKADKTKRKAEEGREDGGEGRQQNGSSSGGQGAKGQAGKKKGGAKSKQRGGKGAAKPAAKSAKPSPRSDDTPAVSKTVMKDAAPASSPSSSSKKAKKKAKTSRKSEGGEAPPKGKGGVGSAPQVAAQPAAKRKHKVSDEPTSSGKKKRKA